MPAHVPVVIIGGGPGRAVARPVARASGASSRSSSSARAASTSWPGCGRAYSSGAPSRRCGRRASGSGWTGRAAVHDGVGLSFSGRHVRIDFKGLTGKGVMVYGQTQVTKDLYAAVDGIGVPVVDCAADVDPPRRDRAGPVRHLRQGRHEPSHRLRARGRVRRLPRSEPHCDTAVGAPHLRADLSLRLARHPVRDAPGRQGADLRPQRAGLRALLDAPLDAEPLLRPVRHRRRHRRLAGRAVLGGAAGPAARRGRRPGS